MPAKNRTFTVNVLTATHCTLKNASPGAGEMAQWLTAPSAPTEDPWPTPFVNSSSKGSDALFWCLWALHAHGAPIHMQNKQNTHKIIKMASMTNFVTYILLQ